VNVFYIYGHIDPVTRQLFYIGKGTRDRAYSRWSRNKHHLSKLNKILANGYNWKDIVIYLEINIKDEHLAYKKEAEYITIVGLDNLVNYSPGGKGSYTYFRKTVSREEFNKYLRSGMKIDHIAKKLGCDIKGLKKRFYPTTSLYEYCVNLKVERARPMAKNISKELYITLISEGKSNKEISSMLDISLNTLKSKFYPNYTLKQFCLENNLEYYNTQAATRNGNYKEFPESEFLELVELGLNLTQISDKLNLSKRVIIKKYKESFKVANWKDLKKNLSSLRS